MAEAEAEATTMADQAISSLRWASIRRRLSFVHRIRVVAACLHNSNQDAHIQTLRTKPREAQLFSMLHQERLALQTWANPCQCNPHNNTVLTHNTTTWVHRRRYIAHLFLIVSFTKADTKIVVPIFVTPTTLVREVKARNPEVLNKISSREDQIDVDLTLLMGRVMAQERF